MSDTVDIGAARVRLIVDAADFDRIISQGKSAITGFGNTAQQAYDRTEKGTRRAADALLDYVNSLGRADTAMDRYLRNASRMGVEKPVLDAATEAWGKYQLSIELAAEAKNDDAAASARAAAGLKELISVQQQSDAAARSAANSAAELRAQQLQQAHAAVAQQSFNVQLGVKDASPDIERQSAAVSAFLPLLDQLKEKEDAVTAAVLRSSEAWAQFTSEQASFEAQAQAVLEVEARQRAAAQAAQEQAITGAQQQQRAANFQQGVNEVFAPGLAIDPEAQQKRNQYEAAFVKIVNAEIDAERELAQTQAAQQSFLKQLQNTEQAAGKTYYQLLELKAAELGISSAASPLISQLKATNESMGNNTISAKQYAFALRGLPAQFTDIFVSLQAGQSPLTVLFQQGGQIKDMFGGIKTAIIAVSRETAKLATNPYVLLAVALSTVAIAAYQAATRVENLAIATAQADQVAGNAKNLSALANALTLKPNISTGNAYEAVSTLAQAGLLFGTNFQFAAEASAHWATVTGQSAAQVAQQFNSLAKDPLEAVRNGVLRVTDAQYAQLVALDRVGEKNKEVALAVSLFYDQLERGAESVKENTSGITLVVNDVVTAFKNGFNSLGEYANDGAKAIREAYTGNFLDKLKATAGLAAMAGPGVALATDVTGLGKTPGGNVQTAKPISEFDDTKKLTEAQTSANEKLQLSFDQLGTKTEIYNTELAKLNATIKQASAGELAHLGITLDSTGKAAGAGYQKLVNGLRLKVFGQNEGGDPTLPIKQWEKSALDAVKSVQQAVDYMYADHTIEAEKYYDKSRTDAMLDEEVQLSSIDKQIAALKLRNNPNDLAKINALTEQAATVQQQYSITVGKLNRDEVLAVRARTAAYRDYLQALTDANDQLARQGSQAARGVGLSSRDASLADAKDNAVAAAALRDRATDQALAGKQISQAQADQQHADSAGALAKQLQILQGNYDSLSTAESSYLNGSMKAWAEWAQDVANNAQFASKLVTDSLNGVADSITNLITTGKSGFKDLFATLSKEIIEFGVKQAEAAAVSGYSGGGGFGGLLSSLFGIFDGSGNKGALAGAGSSAGSTAALGLSLLGSANGNAFSSGSGLAAYRDSIVKSATYFPFAKGGVPNVGLMGERSGSPGEAIMPLTRTSGGELAVKAVGKYQQRSVVVNQTFVVPGAANRSTQDQIANRTYGAAQRAARRA